MSDLFPDPRPAPAPVGAITARALADVIASAKVNLSVETKTQAELYLHLVEALPDLKHLIKREHKLSKQERPDLFIEGVAVEVKLRGKWSAFEVYRQLKRYAEHESVHAIILASTLTMAVPDLIEGKPAFHVNLGRAWMM